MYIFISFSNQDFEIAKNIYNILERSQISVEWERTGLVPTDNLYQKISSKIVDAECLVALISEKSLKSPWVQNELYIAQKIGIKLLLVLLGLNENDLPNNLKFSADLPQELRDRANLLLIKLTKNPSPQEYGTIPKIAYQILNRIYSGAIWRKPPNEFLYITPNQNSFARIKLIFGNSLKFGRNYAFGNTAFICPTSQDGNLGGYVTKDTLSMFFKENEILEFPSEYITPHQPKIIKELDKNFIKYYFIAATVFNDQNNPKSSDQSEAAYNILKLAEEENISLVICPLLGTGRHYRYPRFQAYKSFIMGTLRYFLSNKGKRDTPWLILMIPNPDKNLILGYNNQIDFESKKIDELSEGKIEIHIKGYTGSIKCANTDSIKSILQREKIKFKNSNKCAILMGNTPDKCVDKCHIKRYLERTENSKFEYDLTDLIKDTIISDGDYLEIIK